MSSRSKRKNDICNNVANVCKLQFLGGWMGNSDNPTQRHNSTTLGSIVDISFADITLARYILCDVSDVLTLSYHKAVFIESKGHTRRPYLNTGRTSQVNGWRIKISYTRRMWFINVKETTMERKDDRNGMKTLLRNASESALAARRKALRNEEHYQINQSE